MSSLLKPILSLLVNKGRDLAAEKLKDGDVTDQQFRNLVVRELDDIKSKIDGLARKDKDLLTSLKFFKEGLEILYTELLQQQEFGKFDLENALPGKEDEKLAVSLPSASGVSNRSVNTRSLVEEMKMLKLDELNETAKQLFAHAKKRFVDARIEATRAFNNEALQLVDRVLAMKIRIMATLMEDVDNPNTSLVSCRLCLEELHNILAVQNCFEVEVTKPFKYRFNKNDRRQIIAEVCHMNFVVYSVTKMVGGDLRDAFKLPVIDNRKLKIDPLRDSRLMKALKKFKLEHCRLSEWTFGQGEGMNPRLKGPWGISTNTRGYFIVIDYLNVKVFDSSGKFLLSFCDFTVDEQEQKAFRPRNVATDGNDNVYVLVALHNRLEDRWLGVYVFDQLYNLLHKFPLRKRVEIYFITSSLTVSNEGKVFVVVKCDNVSQVDVYESNGQFSHSFGQGILSSSGDITTANDDRVMVLNRYTRCVHVFSTQGDHLHQFTVQGNTVFGAIAFHQPSEHAIVSSHNPDNEYRGQVSIYTKDGEFVHSVQVNTAKYQCRLLGLTVTRDGSIAVGNYY